MPVIVLNLVQMSLPSDLLVDTMSVCYLPEFPVAHFDGSEALLISDNRAAPCMVRVSCKIKPQKKQCKTGILL